MIDLDLKLLNVFEFMYERLFTNDSVYVVLKSPLRITHLKFLSEWSGWLK